MKNSKVNYPHRSIGQNYRKQNTNKEHSESSSSYSTVPYNENETSSGASDMERSPTERMISKRSKYGNNTYHQEEGIVEREQGNGCPGCQGHWSTCSKRLESKRSELGNFMREAMGKKESHSHPSSSQVERAIGRPLHASSPHIKGGMENQSIPPHHDMRRSQMDSTPVLEENYGVLTTSKNNREKMGEGETEADYVFELSTDATNGRSFHLSRGAKSRKSADLADNKTKYIGAMNSGAAEKMLTQNATFALYHRTSAERMPDTDKLRLFVVYKSSTGRHHHLPIIREQFPSTGYLYRVDTLDKKQTPLFPTIEQLVKYYNVYVHLRKSKSTGSVVVDVFNTSGVSVISQD